MTFCFRLTFALAAALAALGAASCGGGVTESGPSPITPVDTIRPGPPAVQRGSLSVQVGVDADDESLASAVSLSRAGLTVRLLRDGSAEAPRTSVTDVSGVARFDSLLEGRYQLAVDLPLSASEISKLPTESYDVTFFGAGATVDYLPPSHAVTLYLVASRRGSLVVSEVLNWRGNQNDLAYPWATYEEVYNASDTTIYLDGILLARTWGGMHSVNTTVGCSAHNVAARMDSTQIWLGLIWAFPGSGRQYPILPGEAKVIAMDAINHIAAGVDLSRAPFEHFGSDADTDNPDAADMRRVVASTGAFGRGHPAAQGEATVLLLPGAEGRLVADSLRAGNGGYRAAHRAPREFVLDVVSFESPIVSPGFEHCRPFMAPVYDQQPSHARFIPEPRGIARRTLGRTSGGRELLQRTRNSARDFELRLPLRRSLNK